MAIANLPGGRNALIGPGAMTPLGTPGGLGQVTLDAANEAISFLGRMATSDGAAHTIDTTGSSLLEFRLANIGFANAGTTLKIGLAGIDASGRPSNAADVVNFDVHAALVGGGGGLATTTWNTAVPTAGSKTINSGDLVAFSMQLTARGGTDFINANYALAETGGFQIPRVQSFTGGAYAVAAGIPNVIVRFSDGAYGWFAGTDVYSTSSLRTWNSGGGTKEYGQLFNLPFPVRVEGIYGWVDADADFDAVLYSSPLGSPVAERTVSFDTDLRASTGVRKFFLPFASPFDCAANTDYVISYKPGASSISAYWMIQGHAGHRVSLPWGTSGYGVTRGTGAFSNANSSLEHYYIGLMAGGFEAGGGGVKAPLFGGGVI